MASSNTPAARLRIFSMSAAALPRSSQKTHSHFNDDTAVKAVFIIFSAGILRLRCSRHRPLSPAQRNSQLTVPVVVRMEGTNVEQGQQILRDSGSISLSANA